MIDLNNLAKKIGQSYQRDPFDHWVIDDFLPHQLATSLSKDFIPYSSPVWVEYNTSHQVKKACSDWYHFPASIYSTIAWLNSHQFVNFLSQQFGISLSPDPGLHAGGCHIHDQGGQLGSHIDYQHHPKLQLQRAINLIIYLTESWQQHHGGHLGLYSGPNQLVREILPKFNRAVMFRSDHRSWHGLCQPIQVPNGMYRKSVAIYYLQQCEIGSWTNTSALFQSTDQ